MLLNSELEGLWAVLDWIGEKGSRAIHEKLRGEDDCSSPIPRLYVSSSFVTFFCESRLYLTSPIHDTVVSVHIRDSLDRAGEGIAAGHEKTGSF